MSSLPADRRGAAYVELLIAVIPFLASVLFALQSVLLEVAHLAVERAADAAARSAVVVLDDDPRQYRGEPRGAAVPGSARLGAIRRGASNVLAALSTAPLDDLSSRLRVEFPVQPGSEQVRAAFAPDEIVTVRVGYLFRCRVPLAGVLMCRDGGGGASLMRAEASLPNQGARYSYGGAAQ